MPQSQRAAFQNHRLHIDARGDLQRKLTSASYVWKRLATRRASCTAEVS